MVIVPTERSQLDMFFEDMKDALLGQILQHEESGTKQEEANDSVEEKKSEEPE